MRKYQGIWHKIKTEGQCILVANPLLHRRIKKAVTKEKYYDTVYKVQWDLEGTEQPQLVITVAKDKDGNEIPNSLHFRLIKPVLLGDL